MGTRDDGVEAFVGGLHRPRRCRDERSSRKRSWGRCGVEIAALETGERRRKSRGKTERLVPVGIDHEPIGALVIGLLLRLSFSPRSRLSPEASEQAL